MLRSILSFALVLSLTALAHADHVNKGGNRFHIGGIGKKPSSGRVNFKINGGAGRNPRFEIGDIDGRRFHRASNRYSAAAGAYPVAVGYGGGGNCFFGDGGFSNLYNQGFVPVPPYFALHPPVYYSAPVPRSYGYSPFAYPGTVPTPEVVMGPEEIINPHVVPDDAEEVPVPPQEASQRTASVAPEVIRNPFVDQAEVVKYTARR